MAVRWVESPYPEVPALYDLFDPLPTKFSLPRSRLDLISLTAERNQPVNRLDNMGKEDVNRRWKAPELVAIMSTFGFEDWIDAPVG